MYQEEWENTSMIFKYKFQQTRPSLNILTIPEHSGSIPENTTKNTFCLQQILKIFSNHKIMLYKKMSE